MPPSHYGSAAGEETAMHPSNPEAPQAAPSAPDATGLADLVNRLAYELAEARRALAATTQKLGATNRKLEDRRHELTEARKALSMLLATLDSSSDGILAMGYFDRSLHYNARFVEMWRIPEDKLPTLNDGALLALQLTQVKDPVRFLADVQARETHPDELQFRVIEMMDGRVFECQAMPQRVGGKRVGTVTSFHDVTERERLERVLSVLEAEMPREVAEARASTY
jgi:PAS domain-containing protein